MSGRRRREKKQLGILFRTMGATALALLCLLAAGWLILGGSGDGEADAVAEQEPQDDPQASYEPEEEGAKVAVSTVKEIASETDDVTVGIDVSEFQGNIDWEKAAASDIDFVMVRCGYRSLGTGEITEDACARYNLQEASENGIRLGAYFFSTAVSEEEAREEAQWMCSLLAGYGITYPVAYNCEGFQDPSSRQYSLSVQERTEIAAAFLEEMEAGGYTGMFYAARNELADNLLWETDSLELRYRIWVAQYSDAGADRPEYDGVYAMWQYTNQGSVPGIDAYVDLNVAYFGYSETADALAEGAAEHVEADPEVGVTFEEVSEQVTSKDATNLRTTMEQGDDSNVAGQLKNGETALRTGVGNNGWSRVEYGGKTLYAVSSYLTTDLSYQPPAQEPDDGFKTEFTRVAENVTAKEVTNLRNRPSVEEPSQVIAQLHNGEVIARTGVSDVGWSRVEYNGQTLYCISSYLQTVE
ncbi:MAG: GH25 family lysozyme [Eubacteriales bacterium]|nr:GH25 family lysozyme [Eubacteriales bacterium]